MNLNKPKEHRVWRPRMSSDAEFNPFAHTTGYSNGSYRTLEEMDELRHESVAREDEAEPIKIRGD